MRAESESNETRRRAGRGANESGKDDGVITDIAPLLTVSDVARLMRLCSSTVYSWVAAGRLPCVRLEGRIRFLHRDLLRWIEARKEE